MRFRILVALMLVLFSTNAFAEEGDYAGVGGAKLWFFTGTQGVDPASSSVMNISPELFARYKVMPNLAVSLDWGFSYVSVTPDQGDGISDFALANPYIAGHYILMDEAGMSGSVGLGVTVPIMTVPDLDLTDPTGGEDFAARVANVWSAMAMRGLVKDWMWLPDTFAVTVPIESRMHFKSGLNLGIELTPAYLIYTGDVPDGAEGPDDDFVLDFILDVAYELGTIEPGLAFAAFAKVTGAEEGEDQAQLSIEPYVKANFGNAYGRLGFLINLDEPAGMSFGGEEGELKFWGLNIGGGMQF